MSQEFLQMSYDPAEQIWTSTHYPYKDQVKVSLGERFLKVMRSTEPTKIIDHFYDTNRQKSVREVYEQSITVAKNLQRLGVQKGDVVVFLCMNNEDVSVLTMGCLLIGALVNYFEVFMEGEHMDNVFNTLQPSVILYEENYKSKYQQSLERTQLKSCKHAFSIDGQGSETNITKNLLKYDKPIDFDNFQSVEIKYPQNEVAFLLLTSGSTGVPKIVQISHALMMHGLLIWWDNKNAYEPLQSESVVFSFSPLRWVSQCDMLLESMLLGIKRVSSCGVPNGKYGLELLKTCQVTHIFSAPSIFQSILMELPEHDVESLRSLKLIQLGGEQPLQTLLDLTKKHCVNAKIFKCYGMTEMASCITNDERINGGKLLPGYQMQILDDDCRALGPNQKGQIALKPPYPLLGYKGLNNEKFCNDKGLFINGDYGYMDEIGNIHILGRYKDLIYLNNLRVIPNPLEHIVSEFPEVRTVYMAGYRRAPDDLNEIVAVFVILQSSAKDFEEQVSHKIFNALKSYLSSEEMEPIGMQFHYVDSIPLTTCGKVDRVALKKMALTTPNYSIFS